MCILPDAGRPIVIAVTVEQGGFGDQAAAPVARLIASKWFNQPLKLVNGIERGPNESNARTAEPDHRPRSRPPRAGRPPRSPAGARA